MKFVSYRVVNRESWGVMGADGGVIDLCAEFGNTMPTLRDYLAASDVEKAKVAEYLGTGFGGQTGKASDFPASDITLREPITNPHAIFCVGLNYRKHAEETGNKLPEKPILFPRWPASHVAHGQPMIAPRESEMFDFEGELAVIMGKTARRVSEADALDYVGGYSCYNDGSIRDWQRHTTQFLPGKNFYHSGSFGPWMVSADEIPDPADLAPGNTAQRRDGSERRRQRPDLQCAAAHRLYLDDDRTAPRRRDRDRVRRAASAWPEARSSG